jgi:alkaline phosphatase D
MQQGNVRRRDILGGALLGSAAALLPAAAPARAATRDASIGSLARIGFGSCAKQTKPQPIWDAILELDPELFIMLGDNVYGDTRDPAVLQQQYDLLAAQPGFRRLRERTPILATWDDHDYGEDDAGADYPMKEASRRIFCDFWGESAQSPRRTRDGIYTAHVFGPAGRRVQVLLPDLRFNRTPITLRDLAGTAYDDWTKALEAAQRPVPGPYERNPATDATMLGERQWQWLEAQLREPAEARILASSLQVVADFPGWEGWTVYARDHQRLVQAIRDTRANGLFCISGDTHYAELSRLDVNVPYPLWDLTSSGLTEVWPVLPPNALRMGEAYREQNFGWIEFDWQASPRAMLQARDVQGKVRVEQSLDLGTLRVAGG